MPDGEWEDQAETYLDIDYLDPVERAAAEERLRRTNRKKRITNRSTGMPSTVGYRRDAMAIAKCIFQGAANSEEIGKLVGLSAKRVARYRQLWAKYIENLIEGLWIEHNKTIKDEVKAAKQKTIENMVGLREKADKTVSVVMEQAVENPSAALKAAEYVHGLLGIHDDDAQEAPRSRAQAEQQKLLNDSLGLVSRLIGRPLEQLPESTTKVIEVEAEVIKP